MGVLLGDGDSRLGRERGMNPSSKLLPQWHALVGIKCGGACGSHDHQNTTLFRWARFLASKEHDSLHWVSGPHADLPAVGERGMGNTGMEADTVGC